MNPTIDYSAAQIYGAAAIPQPGSVHGGALALVILIAFGLGVLLGRIIFTPRPARTLAQAALPLALPAPHAPAAAETAAARHDDFKLIPGIGPKVEEALHQGGIRTYAELARSSRERLEQILADSGRTAAGVRSWPVMAALIASQRDPRA